MQLSLYLAQFFGLFFLVLGAGVLLNRDYYRKAAIAYYKQESFVFLGGMIAFSFGLFVVLFHQVWEGWAMSISLLGWAAMLEGLVYFVFPQQVHAWKFKHIGKTTWFVASVGFIVLGFFLAFKGFGG